ERRGIPERGVDAIGVGDPARPRDGGARVLPLLHGEREAQATVARRVRRFAGEGDNCPMSKAPISACLIFRDDPLLEQAVASVRPYVDQICVVIDEDAPDGSYERAVTVADTIDVQQWREDFSFTRNACLKLAVCSHIVWLDTDDIVVGAEHFQREIFASPVAGRILGPYDYETDPRTGLITRQQWRERIVPNDGSWIWEHPTHEGLVKKNGFKIDPGTDYWMKDVRWVHQRAETGKRSRSLKILRDWALTHDDAWVHINLAIELHAAHEYAEAITHFAQHVEKSEWAEERALSCLRAADCAIALDMAGTGGYSEAHSWVRRARTLTPSAFEALYAEAKVGFMRANGLGDPGGLQDTIGWACQALATEETRTPLGRNPQERLYDVHELIRGAAEVEGDWKTALEATEQILATRPESPPHVFAQKKYKARMLLEGTNGRNPGSVPDPYEKKVAFDKTNGRISARVNTASNPLKTAGAAEQIAVNLKPLYEGTAALAKEWEEKVRSEIASAGIAGSDIERMMSVARRVMGPGYVRSVVGDGSATPPYANLAPGEKRFYVNLPGAVTDFSDMHPVIAKVWETPIAAPEPPLDVVFMCGPAPEYWNPETGAQQGAGGSETAVVE